MAKFKAKIESLQITLEGHQILSLRLTEDVRDTYDELNGKDLSIELKEYRKKRSLDANAYAWVLISKLAEKTGLPKTDIYRNAIKDVGGNSDVVCVQDKAVQSLCDGWQRNGLGWLTETFPSKIDGCTNVILYYGSSSYDTAQMSRLIDIVVAECKEQGIETMTPQELEALKEKWIR